MSVDGALYPTPVVAAFAETAFRLYASENVDATFRRIANAALEMMPHCEVTSVSVRDGDRIVTRGSTDVLALRMDAIQYETGEGPCLSALHGERLVLTPDVGTDQRWPAFSKRAAEEAGVASMLSCRLTSIRAPDQIQGSLNMYAPGRDAFDAMDVDLAVLFGVYATAVLDASLHQAQLRQAMESRDIIGQAKGILMVQSGISADQAFDQLRRASQRLNVRLRDLAQRIAERRGLD